MVVRPSLDELLGKVESPYSLVIAAARRARLLNEGAKPLKDSYQGIKPVSHALEEIHEDKIIIRARSPKAIK